jgi:hypothetical protein
MRSRQALVANCPNKCALERSENDQLARAVATAMEKHTGTKADAMESSRLPGEGGAYMTSADISRCKALSYHHMNSGTLHRFNRYRDALPYARATQDLNELGDDQDNEAKRGEREKKCLTLLSGSAANLNASLGLPEGTIRDEHLRDDTTGFRAAVYRSEMDGRYILVARDTQPPSLVDWKTNTDNGAGRDTAQYQSMRELAGLLNKKGVDFDIAGYSKGGGLAQEAGLVSPESEVRVFNSAGLSQESLSAGRTGASSFDSLMARTRSFRARRGTSSPL